MANNGYRDRDVFDPDDVRQEDLDMLADHFEEYINMLNEMMIIPDEIMDSQRKQIKEGIEITKKLIKKLRKGDLSVFKDSDEWN